MPTATIAAGQFHALAAHLQPRQVADLLGIDQSDAVKWLKAAADAVVVPRWACRLLALETGQRLAMPTVPLRSVPYEVDPDAVAWLVQVEGLRTHADWLPEAAELDTAGHHTWFSPEGAFNLPLISKDQAGFSFSNGRHRSVVLSRFLDAIPVGVIGATSKDDLWPLAVRRLEPGEQVLVPDIPLHQSATSYSWQPEHRRARS